MSNDIHGVVITISDSAARGARPDESGPEACRLLREAGYEVGEPVVVPDSRPFIAARIREAATRGAFVITTGGTGLAPRDVTPQATESVLDYDVPGIAETMRAASLRVTPAGMLTRAVAGVRNRTLIVNLPGNPKAVGETMAAIAAALPHAISTLRGEVGEHARPD